MSSLRSIHQENIASIDGVSCTGVVEYSQSYDEFDGQRVLVMHGWTARVDGIALQPGMTVKVETESGSGLAMVASTVRQGDETHSNLAGMEEMKRETTR